VGKAISILFVDDDREIRRVVAESLTLRGFRLLTTDDCYEAMRLLAQEHVDVLITGMVMPDVDGIRLVRHAKLLRPGIHVMMATAYASNANAAASPGKLLHKLLRTDHIETEIRALLAAA
jgi:DNA-binding NtrC family response regulator